MATIQDIHALEERIYDAVQEYLDNPDGYTRTRTSFLYIVRVTRIIQFTHIKYEP